MEQVAIDAGQATIRLGKAELVLINNALNEVVNGADIPDAEFHSRLGESRSDAQQLLQEVGDVCQTMDV